MGAEDDGICFDFHAFCLIDILGQRERLKKWQALPDEEDSPQELAAIRDTVGVVRNFGGLFAGHFARFAKCMSPDWLAAFTSEQQQTYRRIMEHKVVVERFSDTFVFSSPITNNSRDIVLVGLRSLLAACCTAMIDSLANKTPIRGAVTVGKGAVLEDGRFYGPALAEAHHLESEVAQYPRVVVSPTVLQLLGEKQTYSRNADIESVSRQLARSCGAFLAQDVDGYAIVDFLKGIKYAFKPEDPAASSVRQTIKSAMDFVCAEAARFRREHNHKLALRYHLLEDYMKSRLSQWPELV